MIPFQFDDGGREKAGYKGFAGDCVVRAISIASGKLYQEVYDDLKAANAHYAATHRNKVAKKIQTRGPSPRNGNFKDVYGTYIESLGFEWVSCMSIGSGTTVHLHKDDLPQGYIITRLSRHICAVVDGVLRDTHDVSRNGKRAVYGYWIKQD